MALSIYEGKVQMSWQGSDFNNVINVRTDSINTGNKRTVWKKRITYTRCRSNICLQRMNNKCIQALENIPCPNGLTYTIIQPRSHSKPYNEFFDIIEKYPYLEKFGKYSAFVWENRNHKCDQDDYELLKNIPEFAMNKLSRDENTLEEALAIINETKEYQIGHILFNATVGNQLTDSLLTKYSDEVESYCKLVNMEAFLDESTLKLIKFKKNIGPLFYNAGEFILMKIPCLSNFAAHKLENVFYYEEEKNRTYCRGNNAVKIEDFPYIYNYLINHQPNPDLYKAEEYQKYYVPTIKEQFPSFCKDNNIKFSV